MEELTVRSTKKEDSSRRSEIIAASALLVLAAALGIVGCNYLIPDLKNVARDASDADGEVAADDLEAPDLVEGEADADVDLPGDEMLENDPSLEDVSLEPDSSDDMSTVEPDGEGDAEADGDADLIVDLPGEEGEGGVVLVSSAIATVSPETLSSGAVTVSEMGFEHLGVLCADTLCVSGGVTP